MQIPCLHLTFVTERAAQEEKKKIADLPPEGACIKVKRGNDPNGQISTVK
jgi:hypothetical protein